MLRDAYPYYLANKAIQANTDLEVTDKYTGKVATRVAQADAAAIHAAIDRQIAEGASRFPPLPAQGRA